VTGEVNIGELNYHTLGRPTLGLRIILPSSLQKFIK